MNVALAVGQIAIGIFLMLAILLQNRGSGLSSTFGGGDSSGAYRSRRGVERRLWQFTILLAVLFCAFSIAGYFLGK